MSHWVRPSLGLVGRLVAILLLVLAVEFAASTLLYERASQFSVRDDEAHRLAEHLVIARRLVSEQPDNRRPGMAQELTTNRYAIGWDAVPASPIRTEPRLDATRRQVIGWEPTLHDADLRLRFAATGPRTILDGTLRLPDGSAMRFRTLEPVRSARFSAERVVTALVPALLLMLLGGLLVSRALSPLRRLAQAADRVGSGEEAPVREDGTAEVRRLVAAFNRMQARIRRLIADRTQALAAVGHDLRTPLARLRLRSESIPPGELRQAIGHDIEEMDAMVASLLAFLGGDSDPERPVLIDAAVMCATLVDDATDRGRDATYDGPDHCELVARPVGLKRALTNLVDNAFHYGERVTVTLTRDEQTIRIAVADDGPGIPDDQIDSVLEPFVRLDPARGRDTVGFGLGLPIAVQAISAEGGRLSLANAAGGGLIAIVTLPLKRD